MNSSSSHGKSHPRFDLSQTLSIIAVRQQFSWCQDEIDDIVSDGRRDQLSPQATDHFTGQPNPHPADLETATMSLLETQSRGAILARIQNLESQSPAQWGKMNAAQMLVHCRVPLEVAAGERELKKNLLASMFGRFLKNGVVGPKPFKKNLPTVKDFKATDTHDFDKERQALEAAINTFAEKAADRVHPFFGPLTRSEWDTLMVKHIDHHLQQFDV